MFLIHLLVIETTVFLDDINGQCSPEYAFTDSPFQLKQLIAVFRHGARTPLKITDSSWDSKHCVTCADKCMTDVCKSGMLSTDGFQNAKDLGVYIKNNYVPKLSRLETVEGYFSKIDRTYSTLRGVMLGLGEEGIVEREDSIAGNSNSTYVKNQLAGTGRINADMYAVYDNIITSGCSHVPYRCSDFGCNKNKIHDFVRNHEQLFLKDMELIKHNIAASGVSLGHLGHALRKHMMKKDGIVLVSGHDSTIIRLLGALGIQPQSVPPYLAAVFLEIWKDDTRDLVRLVYEGRVAKIGRNGEQYLDLDSFLQRIDMINKVNSELHGQTKIYSDTKMPKNILKRVADLAARKYRIFIEKVKNGISLTTAMFLHRRCCKSCSKPTVHCCRCKKQVIYKKSKSAFDGLPGTCACFDNSSCKDANKNMVSIDKCNIIAPGVILLD